MKEEREAIKNEWRKGSYKKINEEREAIKKRMKKGKL